MMKQQSEESNTANLTERIARGMEIAVEKCLLDKVVKGQSVVYAHSDGSVYKMAAKDALNHFLRESVMADMLNK
ncbi:MAG: hypothetical protein K2J65_07230 [Duncaniella sp.]|nr:hypothetical protein [Duncaniella sp.]